MTQDGLKATFQGMIMEGLKVAFGDMTWEDPNPMFQGMTQAVMFLVTMQESPTRQGLKVAFQGTIQEGQKVMFQWTSQEAASQGMAQERSESSVSKYKKFESNTSKYEFGRSETSFPSYNSGISVVERTSKSRSEGSRDFESGAPSHEVGTLETTGVRHTPSKPEAGVRHTPSKPEASSLLPPQEVSVKETVIHCKVCDIAVPNQFHWGFHAKTKKHLQNMRVLEEGKEVEREREKERKKRSGGRE